MQVKCPGLSLIVPSVRRYSSQQLYFKTKITSPSFALDLLSSFTYGQTQNLPPPYPDTPPCPKPSLLHARPVIYGVRGGPRDMLHRLICRPVMKSVYRSSSAPLRPVPARREQLTSCSDRCDAREGPGRDKIL